MVSSRNSTPNRKPIHRFLGRILNEFEKLYLNVEKDEKLYLNVEKLYLNVEKLDEKLNEMMNSSYFAFEYKFWVRK